MSRTVGLLLSLACTSAFATESTYDRYAPGNRVLGASIAKLESATILKEERRIAPLASEILFSVKPMVRAGGNGMVIQDYVLERLSQVDWRPMAVGYQGYPEAVPVSVNNQVAAALPTDTPFPKAALVTVELIAASSQAHVAQVWTFATPEATEPQMHLLRTGRQALQAGIDQVRAGERVASVGDAIQQVLDANQTVPVRELAGYAMGQMRMQKPQVPGYRSEGDQGPVMEVGQVLNVFVIAKTGSAGVRFQPPDFFTVLGKDEADSVMFSAMVEVTDEGPRVLSRLID